MQLTFLLLIAAKSYIVLIVSRMILPDQGTRTTIMANGPSSRFSGLLFSILNPCDVGAASLNEKTKQRLFIISIYLSIQYPELYTMIPCGYIRHKSCSLGNR